MDESRINKIAKSLVSAEQGLKGWCERTNDLKKYNLYCEQVIGKSAEDEGGAGSGSYAVIEDELVRKYMAFILPEGATSKRLQKAGDIVYATFEINDLLPQEVAEIVANYGIVLEKDERSPEDKGEQYEKGF